jgi:hypothetical protein
MGVGPRSLLTPTARRRAETLPDQFGCFFEFDDLIKTFERHLRAFVRADFIFVFLFLF